MTEPEERPQGEMTLIEHLEELRTRILRSAMAIAVGAVVCFVFRGQILDAIIEPYCQSLPERDNDGFVSQESCRLFQTEPLEEFSLVFTIAAYGGFMLAIPVVLWQAWKFVVPGLYPHERRWAIPFVLSGATLFLFGSGLAYWSIPRALDFLLNFGGDRIDSLLTPGPYIAFVVKMLVAFGLGFQFPLVLIFLQLVGVLSTDTLKSGRRYAIVGIVVLVAILTPSGDPITLTVLSVPMYIFYEASVIFGVLRARRARKAAAVT